MKHKRASPVKESSASLSSSRRYLSPNRPSTHSIDEYDELTPSKKQKRLDTSSSFISSSPKRATGKLTPKRPISRNLSSEFNAQDQKDDTLVEAHIEITSSTVTVDDAPCKKSMFSTLFSPLFKQYNSIFGSACEMESNKENIHVDENGSLVHVTEKTVVETEEVYTVSTELASDETLSDNSPEKAEKSEDYHTASEGEHESEEVQDDDGDVDEFDPYLFIANLPHLHTVQMKRPVALPPKRDTDPEITLVLDLDETLVHCSTEPMDHHEITFPVVFNDIEYQVYVRKRPHFLKFLEAVSKKFEVVVFTASQEVYAKNLLKILDPEQKLIHHQLYRDSCINVEGNFLKDLTILGRDLSKVIIVDNSPQTFGYQIDNGIPILSWFEDNEDRELETLIPFLHSIHSTDDVRPHITKRYGLIQRVNSLRKESNRRISNS